MNLSSFPNISKPPPTPSSFRKTWVVFPSNLPTPQIREGWHLSTTSHASRQLADLGRIFLDSLDSWIYPTPLDRVGLDCPPGWRCSVCVCVCACVFFGILVNFLGGLAWINFGHVVWGSHKPENYGCSTLESVDNLKFDEKLFNL